MKKRDPFDLQALAETREEIEFQREQRMARFRDQVKAAMSTKDGREMIFSILDLCHLPGSHAALQQLDGSDHYHACSVIE